MTGLVIIHHLSFIVHRFLSITFYSIINNMAYNFIIISFQDIPPFAKATAGKQVLI
jgi:hypothetical protein